MAQESGGSQPRQEAASMGPFRPHGQLPGRRLAPSITPLQPVITLDIDDLEEGQLERARTLINEARTPWAVSSPPKARLQAVRLHADGIHRRLYDRLRQGR